MSVTRSHTRRAALIVAGVLTCVVATTTGQTLASTPTAGRAGSVTGAQVSSEAYAASAFDSPSQNQICARTGSKDDNEGDLTADGGTVSRAATLDFTFTSPEDDADTTHVTESAKSVAGIATAGGIFSKLAFSANEAVDVTRSLGEATDSGCRFTTLFTAGRSQASVTVPSGYFTLAALSKAGGETKMRIDNDDFDTVLDLRALADDGAQVSRSYLPAGTYDIYVSHELQPETNTAGDESHSGSGAAVALFGRPGTAFNTQTGTATPYVTLPAARSCTTGAVTSKVTGKAAQVKKVTVTAGKTTRSVLNPAGGATVTIPASAKDAINVKVAVLLKNGTTKSGTRPYLPCAPAN